MGATFKIIIFNLNFTFKFTFEMYREAILNSTDMSNRRTIQTTSKR